MQTLFPAAHLALSLVILVWDVILAGRIARMPQASGTFATLTGLIALLAIPALVVGLAGTTVITGRAIRFVDWIWPAVLVLFAVQALWALTRRVVNLAWGLPIAVYDILLPAAGIVHYLVARGVPVADPLLVLLTAQTGALALAATPAAMSTPIYLNVPMIAPAFPALRPITAGFRAVLAAIALGWVTLTALQLPDAVRAQRSYRNHATDRLTERPQGDFSVGLKLFPDVADAPPPPAITNDLSLADTLGVDVVSVVLVPDVSDAVLDSVAHTIDQLQRDSTLLIVSLGYRGKLIPELGHVALAPQQRLAAIRRIVRRLHPDIVLPAEDPYGVGSRLVGRLPVESWRDYLTHAATAAKGIDRRVKVGVSASAFDARDSALYAWAAGPGSPIDIVGFSFFPSRRGAESIDGDMRAADRWMRVIPPVKEHWVFAAGGYPLAHGEESQAEAIWAALAWATAHPNIKGLVVYEAGDYGQSRGLRAPTGRLRPATITVLRGIRALREAVIAPPAP